MFAQHVQVMSVSARDTDEVFGSVDLQGCSAIAAELHVHIVYVSCWAALVQTGGSPASVGKCWAKVLGSRLSVTALGCICVICVCMMRPALAAALLFDFSFHMAQSDLLQL